MSLLKNIFIMALILLTMNLYFPSIHFAQEIQLYSNWVATRSPEIQSAPKPEIRSTPEEKMPARKVAKKKSKWLWWVLGMAAVGGGAYYFTQDKEKPDEEDTGSGTITW